MDGRCELLMNPGHGWILPSAKDGWKMLIFFQNANNGFRFFFSGSFAGSSFAGVKCVFDVLHPVPVLVFFHNSLRHGAECVRFVVWIKSWNLVNTQIKWIMLWGSGTRTSAQRSAISWRYPLTRPHPRFGQGQMMHHYRDYAEVLLVFSSNWWYGNIMIPLRYWTFIENTTNTIKFLTPWNTYQGIMGLNMPGVNTSFANLGITA